MKLYTACLLVVCFAYTGCTYNKQPIISKAINDEKILTAKENTDDTVAKAIDSTNVKVSQINQEEKNNLPSLSQFIPKGYIILETTSGNLNLDKYPDMILVLDKNVKESLSDGLGNPEKRPLLILIGQADHSYRLVARNDNVVYSSDSGGIMGDPFVQVVIKKDYFTVEHYGGSAWRWTRNITFKYSSAGIHWYLNKDVSESFHVFEPQKVTTKVKTTKDFGKVGFGKFDIYKED